MAHLANHAIDQMEMLTKEAMKKVSDNETINAVADQLRVKMIKEQFERQVDRRKQKRFSDEALTFLLGIALSLLGFDLDETEKKTVNLCMGLSGAFLAPIIIKRMLLDVDEDDSWFSTLLETILIPTSVLFMMIGVGALTYGIDHETGAYVCTVGGFTIIGYFGALYVRFTIDRKAREAAEAKAKISDNVAAVALKSLKIVRAKKAAEGEDEDVKDDSNLTGDVPRSSE